MTTNLLPKFDIAVSGNHHTPIATTRKVAVDMGTAETADKFEEMMQGARKANDDISKKIIDELKEVYTGVKADSIAQQRFTVPMTQGYAVHATVQPTARAGVPEKSGDPIETKPFGVSLSISVTPGADVVAGRKEMIEAVRSSLT